MMWLLPLLLVVGAVGAVGVAGDVLLRTGSSCLAPGQPFVVLDRLKFSTLDPCDGGVRPEICLNQPMPVDESTILWPYVIQVVDTAHWIPMQNASKFTRTGDWGDSINGPNQRCYTVFPHSPMDWTIVLMEQSFRYPTSSSPEHRTVPIAVPNWNITWHGCFDPPPPPPANTTYPDRRACESGNRLSSSGTDPVGSSTGGSEVGQEVPPPTSSSTTQIGDTSGLAIIIGCAVGAGCLVLIAGFVVYRRELCGPTPVRPPGLASIAPADVVVSLKPDNDASPVVIHMQQPCYGHPEGHAYRKRWGCASWACCLFGTGCCCGYCCALAHRKGICKHCGHRSDA